MAKKNRQKLQQLIAKRQQLQVLQTNQPTSPTTQPKLSSQPLALTTAEPITDQPAINYQVGREIRRTAVSIGVIIILLAAGFIVDKKTSQFQIFGDWLYRNLRLAS